MAAGSINALIGAQRSGSVIDRIANPPSVNPLGGIQAGADAAKTVMGVRALAGQQAWGEALQQATDPNTGRVDYGKAQSILAADPRGTLAMQGAATNSSGLMNDQVSRAHYQMGLVHGIVGGLPDNASRADITAALDRLGPLGISPTDLAADKAAIPTDDNALPGYIQQFRAAPESGPTQLNMRYGTPGMTNVGGVLQPYTQAPINRGAAVAPAPGGLILGMTPAELLAPSTFPPVPERDANGLPTGRTIPMSQGEHLEMTGQIPQGTMARIKAGIGSSTGGDMGTGRPPAALLNPANTAPGAPPATAAAPPPAPAAAAPALPSRAGLTLSPVEASRLQTAAPDFRKEVDQGNAAVQQSALLGNMLADATSFAPGSGASALQAFQSRVQYWAPPLAKAFGIDPNSLAGKEGFDKIAAQIANSQGAQTDDRLAVIQAATPHAEMTPVGVDKIIRQLQGNADYQQYRAKMAAAYPRQYDYQGFQKDAQQLDPRVFQLGRMTDPQRKEYWGQLDSTTKAQLGNAIRYKSALDKQMAGG